VKRAGERDRALSTGLFVLFAAFACWEFQTAWLGSAFPSVFRRGDPTAENANWRPLALVINTSNLADSTRDLVLTSAWREAAKVDQGLDGRYHVAVISNDPRNFAIGIRPADFAGHNGWIVLQAITSPPTVAAIKDCYATTQYVSTVTIARGARPDAQLTVWRGNDFLPGRCDMSSFSD
jgi:hypothetical protein